MSTQADADRISSLRLLLAKTVESETELTEKVCEQQQTIHTLTQKLETQKQRLSHSQQQFDNDKKIFQEQARY